ncbi:MAG: hypothetical protein IJ418_03870 [Clostridia bacterium]|nr:hypothetical protein [Clostridia bacterium]
MNIKKSATNEFEPRDLRNAFGPVPDSFTKALNNVLMAIRNEDIKESKEQEKSKHNDKPSGVGR